MRQAARTADQVEKNLAPAPVVDKRKEKKEFEIVPEDDGGLYQIKYNAGGEIPRMLQGRFTGIARAQAAIDNYIADRTAPPNG